MESGVKKGETKGLEVRNVSKTYQNHCGIKNLSIFIKQGEITAIIGPNGAGKTTLVRSIAGLARISDGEITLSGISTSKREIRARIGYMQEELGFYDKMTVYEVLDFICKVKYGGHFHEEIDDWLKKYDLYEKRNVLIRRLSMGMKKKLSIIMALLGRPELIILDEPTNGVDTFGIIQLKRDLIQSASQNSTIIVTSHVLDWVEKLCTRCVFLKAGEMERDICLENGNWDLEKEFKTIYGNDSVQQSLRR